MEEAYQRHLTVTATVVLNLGFAYFDLTQSTNLMSQDTLLEPPLSLSFLPLLKLGVGTSSLGATTSAGVFSARTGGELTGIGPSGELIGTGAGGKLTRVTIGGVAVGGLAAGGVVAGGVATGAGAAALDGGDATVGDEAGGVAVATLGNANKKTYLTRKIVRKGTF
ncbi:hypothetical protein GYH30_033315 [Glycine max]|nr:hypothetical protein GYH30_033315 [Glycine max]